MHVVDNTYLPLYGERRCKHCGFWRGQHGISEWGDGSDDADMSCPSTTTFVPVDTVICQRCVNQGTQSVVRSQLQVARRDRFPDEFWDEEGVEHHHDPHFNTRTFRCNNSHTWSVEMKKRCPAEGCDYNQ